MLHNKNPYFSKLGEGMADLKRIALSAFTQPLVVPNLYDFHSSMEHKTWDSGMPLFSIQ